MISAMVGATVVLGASAVLKWPTAPTGAGYGGSDSEQSRAAATQAVRNATAGSCLDWTTANANDIHAVPCSEPHLFEVTGITDLSDQFGTKAAFPTREQWQDIKKKYCVPVTKRYLNGNFDPNGRFKVGALTPTKTAWQSGDRSLQCGLRQPGPAQRLYRFTGSVTELDQSAIYPVGTCFGINGTSVSAPVDCSKPHSVEITGIVDLGKHFKKGYPKVAKQDDFLFEKCKKLTAKYAGNKKAAEKEGLQVYWSNMAKKSWQAGSRKVNCKVSAVLPDDGGLAPVTGSIKGNVTVGKKPAPTRPTPTAPTDGPR